MKNLKYWSSWWSYQKLNKWPRNTKFSKKKMQIFCSFSNLSLIGQIEKDEKQNKTWIDRTCKKSVTNDVTYRDILHYPKSDIWVLRINRKVGLSMASWTNSSKSRKTLSNLPQSTSSKNPKSRFRVLTDSLIIDPIVYFIEYMQISIQT